MIGSVSASGFLIRLCEEFLYKLPIVAGLALGGVIVLTNAQKLLKYFGIASPWSTIIYVVIVIGWATFVFLAWQTSRAPEFVPAELEEEVALIDGEPAAPAADDLR